MPDLGVRLQLLLGPTVAVPAPFPVVDALQQLEVFNNDTERDGFQMTFSLGRDTMFDYGLLKNGYFDPPNRVIVVVLINAVPQVLIDGLITNHQVTSSNHPGQSRLVVTGDDISLKLDLEPKSTTHKNEADSTTVKKILNLYDLVPDVTDTTDTPSESDRVPSQQLTDLAHIRTLAERNGFVFYIEPTPVPGFNTAYWGPDNRKGRPQPALTMNMGPNNNVDQLNFTFDALGPVAPTLTILDPTTKQPISIAVPSSLRPSLAGRSAQPLRKDASRDSANLSYLQAALKALADVMSSSDAYQATGEVDAVRYGRALRSRRLVGVRGAGQDHDGVYYVKQVTHRIRRGSYTQSFVLKREGRGAVGTTVVA